MAAETRSWGHRTICSKSYAKRPQSGLNVLGALAQLWLILGDGVNQAADLASGATSIPF